MYYLYSALVFICLVLVTVFCLVRIKGANSTSLVLKTFASLIFVIICGVSVIYNNSPVTSAMFVLGAIMGLIGDMLLDLKIMDKQNDKLYLNFGTLCFGVGHVFYFFGLLTFLSDKTVTGFWWVVLFSFLLSLLLGYGLVKISPSLKLNLTGFKWQSFLYSTLLIFCAIISFCVSLVVPITWVCTLGFILFFASDLVLSMQYFGGKQHNAPLTIINHVLYYTSQLLLASFVFFV